jgi:hypothetical protein
MRALESPTSSIRPALSWIVRSIRRRAHRLIDDGRYTVGRNAAAAEGVTLIAELEPP